MDKTKVGIVGCGTVSEVSLANFEKKFKNVEVAAVADLMPQRARAQADAHHVPCACSVEELLADPAIEIVLNLTVPRASEQRRTHSSARGSRPASASSMKGRSACLSPLRRL